MSYRIAAVSFLNAIPLVEWFTAADHPEVALERALPSLLPGKLMRGEADGALLPVVEIFRGDCRLLGGTGIAGRGAVDSVKLFVRAQGRCSLDMRSLSDLTHIGVDRGSRTSVALLRILLSESGVPCPGFVEVQPRPGRSLEPSEGMLVIGDRCFEFDRWRREDPRGADVLAVDLGQAWFDFTGLPFVFAAWAAAPAFAQSAGPERVDALADLLTRAREYGIAHLDEIVAREAAAGRLGCDGRATADALDRYFRTSLRFRLGPEELAGMECFRGLCIKHGLVATGPGTGETAA